MRLFSTLRALAPCLAAIYLTACQQLPEPKGRDVRVLEVGRLEQVNPNDIVVAPLQYAADEALDLPEQKVRAAFVSALIRRRYAPLALEYVDGGVVEASYRTGLLDEDAVCQVVVHAYDDRLWSARRALIVDLELRMIDPADPIGSPLWAGRLEGRFDFAGGSIEHTSETAHYQASLEHIAQELLAAMPSRRTEPGFE